MIQCNRSDDDDDDDDINNNNNNNNSQKGTIKWFRCHIYIWLVGVYQGKQIPQTQL